jgi:hypothetical protein
MKTKLTLILVFIVSGMLFTSVLNAQPNMSQNKKMTMEMVEFREDMRQLWEDHIVWTRNVIFNIVDGLPGTNEAVGRLLQNQTDLGNAIKPYYGNAAGDQLTALLTGHIVIAADLLTALKNNDVPALTLANQRWFENADSIALFLSNANPNWNFMDLQMMMHEHLNLTTAEAVARNNQDYAGDVLAYDAVHVSILEMADMLSMGIIEQFPAQFRNNSNRTTQYVELTDEATLSQNFPNPFASQTTIDYFIPENVSEAHLNFYNSSGALIKTVKLSGAGEGTLNVSAATLRNGTYTYSLVLDGQIIESKTMVH